MKSTFKRVVALEALGFASMLSLSWIDEILDLPHLLFAADPTPVNWRECIIESVLVLLIGVPIVWFTHRLLFRIQYLEGLLPICASCKKIRKPDADPYAPESWEPIESYFSNTMPVEFSHGMCPDCTKQLHPEFYAKHFGEKAKEEDP